MSALCLDISPHTTTSPPFPLPAPRLPPSMRLLKMDIYSFGGRVASGGFLDSQKARLLAARQISLLFVLHMTHSITLTPKSFAPFFLSPRSVSQEEKDISVLALGLSSCLLLTVKDAIVSCDDNKEQPREVELCTNLESAVKHSSTSPLTTSNLFLCDGQMALQPVEQISLTVCVFVCETFCLSSGALSVRTDSWAAPCGHRQHKKRFFPFKPHA